MDEKKEREYDCFISYHKDTHGAAAKALYVVLRFAGISPWFDPIHLVSGHIERETSGAVDCCREFLLLYSKSWDDRPRCLQELEDFQSCHENRAPLVVKLGPDMPSERFKAYHYYDLSQAEEWRLLLEALRASDEGTDAVLDVLIKPYSPSPVLQLTRTEKELAETKKELDDLREYTALAPGVRKKQKRALDKASEELLRRVLASDVLPQIKDLKENLRKRIESTAPAYAAELSKPRKYSIRDLLTAHYRDAHAITVSIAESIQADNSEDERLWFCWGTALSMLGRDEEACEKYAEAVKHKPDDHQAYSNWGVALGNLGKYKEGCEKYAEAVKHKPDYAVAYNNWAVPLGKLGRYEEACEKLAQAVKHKHDYAEAYYNWGTALSMLGKHEEACEKYAEAVKHKPDDHQAYSNWGVALGNLGKYKEECEKYAEAVKHKPEYAIAYNNWGIALGVLGKYDEALEKCAEAVKLKPDYYEAYASQGELLFCAKRFEEAEASLRRALDGDEKLRSQAGPHIILAATLAAQKKRKKAISELQVQEVLSGESFKVDKPDTVFAAFEPYKDDPEFAPLVENVRKKLGLKEGSKEN